MAMAASMELWVSASGVAAGDGSRGKPFATIAQAQAAVRKRLQAAAPLTGDIVVHIGAGTYRPAAPLAFTAADSGRNGHLVRYRGTAGAMPVISGGLVVTGWTAVQDPKIALPQGAMLWQAAVNAPNGSRQLYVDGTRARRAETNTIESYPLGFRPTYYDLPGISGIEYAIDSRNPANWSNPVGWTNVTDIEAVVYTQWKMISVPLRAVLPPSASIPSLNPAAAPTVGLLQLCDPAWTNANLIRGLPTGTVTATATVIALNGTLAAQSIAPGMTITALGLGSETPLGTVVSVDAAANQVTVSESPLTPGTNVTLSILDAAVQGGQALGQPNEWAFWRVTKFVNAYQFLSAPGDWYLDRAAGALYLMAANGDDPNTHAIELAVQETLLSGDGAANLVFEGLCFECATWMGPSRVTLDAHGNPSAEGYVDDQAGFHVTGTGHEVNQTGHALVVTRMPGNISFHNAKGVSFLGNLFRHLGGAGLDLSGGAQDCRLSGNGFTDVSGTAIQIGGVNAEDARPASDAGICRNNRVDRNHVINNGVEFVDTPGICLGYAQNTSIEGNNISGTAWAGISIGWGWGLRDQWIATDPYTGKPVEMGGFPGVDGAQIGMWGMNTTPTIMGGNRVIGNMITDFLRTSWDGGAIYTTGFQDGAVSGNGLLIASNIASGKTPGAGGNVLYTDGGSRTITVVGNILYDNETGGFNFGPKFDDPLNANNPLQILPDANGLPYGSDIGGCCTFGEIAYHGNLWESWWTENPYSVNPSNFPLNPLFYDPGSRGTTNDPLQAMVALPGAPYPTGLTFDGNLIIGGASGRQLRDPAHIIASAWPVAVSAVRLDSLGGALSFGLRSLADGAAVVHCAGAAPGGKTAAGPQQMVPGVWLPIATRDGQALALTELSSDGDDHLANFAGGYRCRFTLHGGVPGRR